MIRIIGLLGLKFRILVIGVTAILLGLGAAQLRRASVDEFPEFAPPLVQVQAEALGLSAAEVEQLITVPLEQDLLNGVPWLDQIRSESVPGLSTIDMIFQPGTKILQARQMVQEHLTQAHALPQVGTPPVMVQPTASAGRVLMVSLGAKDLSLIDLSILARWKIKPRLEGLPGVANVAIWGQRDRQLQVQVDPEKLRTFGVTLSQVINTTGNALWVSPLTFVEASTPGTGGFVDTPSQRFGIQHVTPITTAAGLSAVTVEDTTGRTLRLGQVADVVEDHQPLIGDAVLSDDPGLMLVIQKFPGANTREVTTAVENALADMRPGLSGVTINTTVYRPATFIDNALHNLALRGVLGLILVAILLGLYLFSWRLAVISLVTLLLSLVSAAYVLYLRGLTFNVMVLAGFTAAVGVVIADAVVDPDVLRRRLAEHPQPADGDTRTSPDTADTVAEASHSVRAPLVYATLILLLIPLPALALGGVAGAFARSVVVSYLLAVAVAMLVALLVTPALSSVLLSQNHARQHVSPLARLAERGFDRFVSRYLRVPRALYGALAVLILAGLAVLPQLGNSHKMLPAMQDRNLSIHWQAASGTSLREMARITTLATRDLRGVPGVRNVGSHAGRALMADQSVNVNSAELWVSLDSKANYARAVTDVKNVVSRYPGMRADVSTYPADRIAAADTREHDPLVVRVYGHDLTELATKAGDVRTMLSGVRGVVRPTVQAQAVEPSVQIQVNLAAAQRYGITPGDVRRASATLFAGLPVGSLYEDQKIFDVVVWGVPASRQRPTDVTDLLLDAPSGGHVRLGDVADVRIAAAPTVIRHDNISRSLDVTAGVSGRSVNSVIREVKAQLASLPMPLEFHAEVLSGATQYRAEHWRVASVALAVAVAILLLLQSAFGSWRLAGLLFVAIPLGVSGGAVAALFVDGIRTLPAMLGMLAVLGIVIRNGILLTRSYQNAGADPDTPSVAEGVLAATRAQVTPIVLTALLTAGSMFPLAVAGVVGGTEILQPLAVVVLGGLISATLWSVFLLPALYLRFSARPAHSTRHARPARPTRRARRARRVHERPASATSSTPAGVSVQPGEKRG
jgi:Cu/Ag efflux pump CusA